MWNWLCIYLHALIIYGSLFNEIILTPALIGVMRHFLQWIKCSYCIYFIILDFICTYFAHFYTTASFIYRGSEAPPIWLACFIQYVLYSMLFWLQYLKGFIKTVVNEVKYSHKSDTIEKMLWSLFSVYVDIQSSVYVSVYLSVYHSVYHSMCALQCWRTWTQWECRPRCNMMNKFITEPYRAQALQHSSSSYAQTCLSIK